MSQSKKQEAPAAAPPPPPPSYADYGVLAPTGFDIEGPYYLSGAPFRSVLCSYPTMRLRGRVLDVHARPVKSALLDFWQADHHGVYDVEGFHFRGKVLSSEEDGSYWVDTVLPGRYQIDQAHERCRHLHVKVSAPGHCSLTTQLYFPPMGKTGGSQSLDEDANGKDRWFHPSRLVSLVIPVPPECPYAVLAEFTFVLLPHGQKATPC